MASGRSNITLMVAIVLGLIGGMTAHADWQTFPIRENGSIPIWTIAGPFPNASLLTHGSGCFGYFTDYLEPWGGEAKCVPAAGDTVPREGGESLVWRTAFADETGLLDFIESFEMDKETPGVVYSFCRLISEAPLSAVLKVSSNDGVRIWLNGYLVHANHIGRTVDEGGIDSVPVELKAGRNDLMVKVDQGLGGWGQRIRVEGQGGTPPPGLRIEVSDPEPIADALHRATLRTASLVARTPDGERQVVNAIIDSGGVAGLRCRIVMPDWQAPAEFDLGELPLGRHHVTLRIPRVREEGLATVSFEDAVGNSVNERVHFSPPREWTVYCVQHTHTDMGYTRAQIELLPDFLQFIDTALDYCDRTDEYPEDARFRWTCEASWVVREYLRRRPHEQIERLRRRVEEGRIEITALYLNMDDLADESVLADSLKPIQNFRDAGFTVTTAMQNDVPGAAWCLVDYLDELGVPYLTMGINNDRTPRPFNKPTAFWWESPSGRRVLAYRPDHYHTGNQLGIHQGRLDTLTERTMEYLDILSAKDYPFDAVAIQYSGIQIDNSPPTLTGSDLIRQWNDAYVWPKMRNAIAREFPQYVKARHADELPTYRGAWPNWWTDGYAFAHVETARARRAHVDFNVAQTLLSMAALSGARVPAAAFLQMERVETDLLFYDEHTFGAQEEFTDPMAENSVVQWGEKTAHVWNAAKGCTMLQETAIGLLDPYLPRATVPTVTVFNTLNWSRSGTVEVYVGHDLLPLDSELGFVDATTGRPIPYQLRKSRFEGSYWTLWVDDIPPLGYKQLRIEPTKALEVHPDSTMREIPDGLISKYYNVTLSQETGALISLVDRESNMELIDSAAPWHLGQFVYDVLTDNSFSDRDSYLERSTRTTVRNVHVERIGKLGIWDGWRIAYDADGCVEDADKPALVCEIRIFNFKKQIDFCYTIRKAYVKQPESVYIAFPFGVPDGQLLYEVQGGVMRPGLDQLPGSATDWSPVQGFVAVQSPRGQVVFTSDEIPLVQLGDINIGKWEDVADVKNNHVYSWVMNNYWTFGFPGTKQSEFSWTYHLTSMAEPSNTFATRAAAEMRTPLVSRVHPPAVQEFGERSASFLSWQPDNALVVNCVPVQDTHAVVAHVRELAGKSSDLNLTEAYRWEEVDLLGNPTTTQGEPDKLVPYGIRFLKVSRR